MLAKIKALRNKTGLGIAECKKALEANNWDTDLAFTFLRKSGLAITASNEIEPNRHGVIAISYSSLLNSINMIKLESNETIDIEVAQELVNQGNYHVVFISDGQPKESVLAYHKEMEGLFLDRHSSIDSSHKLYSYLHPNNKIGVILELEPSDATFDSSGDIIDWDSIGSDIAMHIAAKDPEYISIKDIPLKIIEEEKEILMSQPDMLLKPEKIRPNILNGRINKFYSNVCLMEQTFVKDPDRKIKDILMGAAITRFYRFSA